MCVDAIRKKMMPLKLFFLEENHRTIYEQKYGEQWRSVMDQFSTLLSGNIIFIDIFRPFFFIGRASGDQMERMIGERKEGEIEIERER